MFKINLASALFVVCLASTPSSIAQPLEHTMQATPARCVALHQGQTCYQLVDISWQLNSIGSYCLFISSSTEALTCWQQNSQQQGVYKYDVQSAEDVVFSIKDMKSLQTVMQLRFEIAWVYNQSQQRRSTWRLF
ncbi:hypothetical protein DS2_17667 [Catenovulum agarivorans DS-2]|uniref:DUF3019 domain-containing protein n=1 Tax=Catenovulum agarivorans DS-2 TaxID=1328313 RepID=W7QJS9_9ALTE|nr:DUF3019 domain-containing protein [Catenovulum agarivorans]EWH08393.1 hypothetical protein DS2_17667 [Catenovulum agarivorans DS-2]